LDPYAKLSDNLGFRFVPAPKLSDNLKSELGECAVVRPPIFGEGGVLLSMRLNATVVGEDRGAQPFFG